MADLKLLLEDYVKINTFYLIKHRFYSGTQFWSTIGI